MNIVLGAVGVITRTANAATAAAGAVGGAAVGGLIGGIRGTASGVRRGMGDGSRSSAAAAVTLAALGASGLVEWPVLITVGGATLAVRELTRQPANREAREAPATLRSVPTPSRPSASKKTTATSKSPARKAARQAPRRKAAARKTTASRRSTT